MKPKKKHSGMRDNGLMSHEQKMAIEKNSLCKACN